MWSITEDRSRNEDSLVVWDYQRTSKVDPNDRHDKHWPFNNFNIFFITY